MNLGFLKKLLAAGALVTLAGAPPAPAAETTPHHWTSASAEVTVSGTSTVHDWTVRGTKASGTVAIPVATDPPALKPEAGAVAATLTIPSKSLIGDMSGLNSRMYTALNVTQYPEITFILDRIAVTAGTGIPAEPSTWSVSGQLELNGTTRNIAFPAQVVWNPDGSLEIQASTSIKMTDYQVKPPTFMFGTLTTGDVITVGVKWHLIPEGKK